MAESNRDEIAKLESMFAANPEGRVFTHLAEAYRKAGELAHAREVLEQGLQRHQDSASGYVVLGRVLQDSGQPEEATTAFGRVLELDPENRVALRALGELAHAGGRHEQALGYFEQLHALDPSDDGVEDLITELQGKIAAAPREPEPVAPLYPETTPSTTLPPPQFTPADFPQDLGNFDLSGFSTSGAETVPKTTPGADLDSSWMNPAAPPAPAASWGEAALPTIPAEGGDAGRAEWGESAPPSVDAAPGLPIGGEMPPVDRFPLPEAAAPELPIGGEMPPIDSFAHQDAAAPDVPEPAAVEGLERVEEPTNVAPIEGLEPADELTGALPIPEREQEPAAPFTPPPSSFDFGPVEEEAPFAEPASAEVVTETMAELYRSQGHLVQAAEVYRALLRDRPGDEQLERKLLEIELAILSPEPAGEPVEEPEADSEVAAWSEPAAEPPVEPVSAEAVSPEPEHLDEGPVPVEAAAEGFVAMDAGAADAAAPVEAAAEGFAAMDAGGADAAAPVEAPAADEVAFVEAAASETAEYAAPIEGAGDEWARPATDDAASLEAAVSPEPAAEQSEAPVESPGWEAAAEPEGIEPPVPAMEEVWGGSGEVATSDATPYAWESGLADEATGPPVSGYLHSLLAWHRSTNGSADAPAPASQADEPAAPPAGEPTETWADPWAEAPQETPAEPEPWSEAAPEPSWSEPAASAEPTWADEAADSPEPWADQSAAPAWEETPPPSPEPEAAPAEPAATDDMAWLLGPEGIAPEKPETPASSAESGDAAPGDDDDLEMFRAWLQSLKK